VIVIFSDIAFWFLKSNGAKLQIFLKFKQKSFQQFY
jgi:hypothetical protein